MTYCPKCGDAAQAGDAFCRKCGASLDGASSAAAASAAPGAAPTPGARRRKPAISIAMSAVGLTVFAGMLMVTFGGGSCGRIEGSFVSTGKPIGDFTFTPAQCRTGARMDFYGVVLVGNGPTEGGLLVAIDPAQGTFLKIEMPGSCQPPDYEKCTEIMIKPEQCTKWDVDVGGTGVTINRMRMMQGHANVECAFPEGGTVKTNLDFGRCF